MPEKSLRQVNLERISTIHKAMRWAAIGSCPEEFKNKTLGELEQELQVRLAFELMAAHNDLIKQAAERPDPSRN